MITSSNQSIDSVKAYLEGMLLAAYAVPSLTQILRTGGLSNEKFEFTLNSDGTINGKDNVKLKRKSETPVETMDRCHHAWIQR